MLKMPVNDLLPVFTYNPGTIAISSSSAVVTRKPPNIFK